MLLKKAKILVIDDDPDVLTAVRILLSTKVEHVIIQNNPNAIPSLLSKEKPDLVLLDMNFDGAIRTGNEGLYWLKKIKSLSPSTPVIMITAFGEIDLAVHSLKEGASDFLLKPWHNERLLETLAETLADKSTSKGKAALKALPSGPSLLGISGAMLDIFKKIDKVAATEANILILGENGTGKELVAESIHAKSLRADKPFVKVDLGSLTESLFESELFGYKKGAFTDAKEERMGRFEAAQGGTLFLDEIANINLFQQAKLLSVLQNRKVTRLGTNQAIPIDIRLICATNASIADLSDETKFRKDLMYRINTVELLIPPLRNRPKDIRLLVNYFLKFYTEKYYKTEMGLSEAAIKKLENYHFPGNVREMQFIIERAVIMSDGTTITDADLIFSYLENAAPQNVESSNSLLSNIEKEAILKVMEHHGGNITKVAKDLGLTRTALYRRLSKYDI